MHGMSYGLFSSVKAWSVGMFAGIVTPGRTGDVIRSLYLKRDGESYGKCISSVVVDRVIDLSVIMGFAAFGAVLMPMFLGQTFPFYLLVIPIIAIFALLYLMTKRRFAGLMLKPVFRYFIPKSYSEKARHGFNDLYDSMGKIRKGGWRLAFLVTFSAFIWLVSILQISFIGLAVGISIDYAFLLAVMSLVVIIELIPVSVFGMGTREAFLIFILGMSGVAGESVIAFSIAYLILAYWSVGLLGLLFWIKDPVKLGI
jgi:uncharacterized protein (TIRG00374 family)